MQSANYLFVVAHADDEVLGAGGTIHRLTGYGATVCVCVLNSVSDIRCKDSPGMMKEMRRSHDVLGIGKEYIGEFETMCFNSTPQLELVQFIEKAIRDCKPQIIITHHPSDLHSDHHQVSVACKAAARLAQRQTDDLPRVRAFYYMEVPSSTDWGEGGTSDGFRPDTFMPISEDDFYAKMEALYVYSEGGVVRRSPHPRSEDMLKARAMVYGSSIGSEFAEAFQTVFREGV